jgi:hypothetical protein
LRQWLTPQQRDQFNSAGYFDVIGCNSGRKYRIFYGVAANVQALDDGGFPTLGLCFVPVGSLPPADVMLAQKIALETSEDAALTIANRFPPGAQPAFSRPRFP